MLTNNLVGKGIVDFTVDVDGSFIELFLSTGEVVVFTIEVSDDYTPVVELLSKDTVLTAHDRYLYRLMGREEYMDELNLSFVNDFG